ncbi:MAG: family 1 glycosylhydrolase [Propionibacteriaceae bacterium]|nr:family 1 glycosylhydrolase [Propionibacteriaceae bacterium]
MNATLAANRPLNGLLIGTASAATQIEGGCRNHQWWQWAQTPGNIADGSSPERANDHWNRWREDNELMAELGFPIARVGLEWARIEPRPGEFDGAAVERYREELADLIAKGIRPLVTLHHFSNPLWLQARGEWTQPGVVDAFLRYVRFTVSALKDLVSEWVTINEPNVYATQAHLFREAPPSDVSPRKLVRVLQHMATAHVRAYEIIHALQPDAVVTIAHHLRDFAPMNPRNPLHRAFTRFNTWAFNDALTEAFGLGKFPRILGKSPLPEGRFVDVIGLNYYSRTAVTGPSDGVFPGRPVSDLGWEIWPEGLVTCARTLHEQLGVPVWITENGCADNGRPGQLERFRPRFLVEHLAAILDSEVPIERYYHWCFVDNWEWAEGEVQRFGIVHNDYETQIRTVKPSGRMLAEIVAAGSLTADIAAQYASGQTYPTSG